MGQKFKKFIVFVEFLVSFLSVLFGILFFVLFIIAYTRQKNASVAPIGVVIILLEVFAIVLGITAMILASRKLKEMKNGAMFETNKTLAFVSLINSAILISLGVIAFVRNTGIIAWTSFPIGVVGLICSIIMFVEMRKKEY